jgi:aerobic carbon-monoxide dehydrogenase large subunit
MPGVVAVWTAADLGVAPHHGFVKVHDDFARPPLAVDRVRFVGEAIAVVLAETTRSGSTTPRSGVGRLSTR